MLGFILYSNAEPEQFSMPLYSNGTTDGYLWLAQRSFSHGVPNYLYSEIPVFADYNGDGAVDISNVFNPNSFGDCEFIENPTTCPQCGSVSHSQCKDSQWFFVDLDGKLDGSWSFLKQANDLSDAVPVQGYLYSLFNYGGGTQIDKIGEEESVGNFLDGTMSIATDSNNEPHIFANLGLDKIYNYHKIGGSWSSNFFTDGKDYNNYMSAYNAGGLNLGPEVKIDSQDSAWVSVSVWTRRAPDSKGIGNSIHYVNDIKNPPNGKVSSFGRISHNSKYSFGGRISVDPYYPNSVFLADDQGNFVQVDKSRAEVRRGLVNSIGGGEKKEFEISSREGQPGVMHIATDWSYQNSIRQDSGSSHIEWSSFGAYPEQGDDGNYMDIGIDLENPNAIYMTTGRGPGYGNIVINMFDGTNLVYPNNRLHVIDTNAAAFGNGMRRYSPQLTPAHGGGAFICWTSADNQIKLKYITIEGANNFGETINIGSGSKCAMATDSEGHIHLIYNNNGVKYRKITTK